MLRVLTHRTEVAPGVFVVTQARIVHDDTGELTEPVKARHVRLEDAQGGTLHADDWPALLHYWTKLRLGFLDPPGLADAIEEEVERLALEHAEGTEAPLFSHGRDNREEDAHAI